MSVKQLVVPKSKMMASNTLNYSRLVVPNRKRSPLWKFFGFPADANGEILSKTKIVCKLCLSVFSYNQNTTNLNSHLTCKHPNDLAKLTGKTDLNKPESSQIVKLEVQKIQKRQKLDSHTFEDDIFDSLESMSDQNLDKVGDYPILVDGFSQTDCSENLLTQLKVFMVQNMIKPNVFDHIGFKSLLELVSSNGNIPHGSQVSKRTLKYVQTFRNSEFFEHFYRLWVRFSLIITDCNENQQTNLKLYLNSNGFVS